MVTMLLAEYLKSMNINCDYVFIDSQSNVMNMFEGEFVGQCSPLFRWVGGKTQLLSAIKFYSPQKYDTYFEPFIGGGALLFSLMPKKAVINDANPVIINLYKDVRDNYKALLCVLEQVSKLPETEAVYLTVRDIFNEYLKKGLYNVEMSALFMYINAKCFNSLYRVNSKGEFNVGYRKEFKIQTVYSPEMFQYAHDYFKNNQVDILSGDYLKCTEKANKGDYVYFDPPYYPVSGTKSFTGYNQNGFNEQNQIDLANEFKRLTDIGVKCVMSNSYCDFITNLYSDPRYQIKVLDVNYYIQPTSDDIKRQECIIRNFQ